MQTWQITNLAKWGFEIAISIQQVISQPTKQNVLDQIWFDAGRLTDVYFKLGFVRWNKKGDDDHVIDE